MNLKDFFDKVVCINLDWRADRWQRFQENVASAGWPFREIERFPAVDGHKVPAPGWWRAGGGAWGCHQSHVRILQQAIQEGAESVLILEDDAVLPQRFPEVVEEFLAKLPGAADWDAIMLGGQHLRPPEIVDNGIVKVRNGNRTHAHALRGNYIKDAYLHLTNYPEHAQRPGFHVDHRLGMLHDSGRYKVYAPDPWLVGQANGHSDIAGADFSLRFWSGEPRDSQTLPPFVAVIGLHRSGSSALAGVLHKLGVHLGNQLGGYEPTGGFEAVTLAHLCERAYPFPSTTLAVPREQLMRELRDFIHEKRREAYWKNTITGGKYPHLCAMGDELREICGDALRVIHIDRPIDESIHSLKKRAAKETGWLRITDDQAEAVQRWLWERKTAFLAEVEHLTIEFDDLRTNPATQIERIIDHIGVEPTDTQIASANSHVRTESPAASRHV